MGNFDAALQGLPPYMGASALNGIGGAAAPSYDDGLGRPPMAGISGPALQASATAPAASALGASPLAYGGCTSTRCGCGGGAGPTAERVVSKSSSGYAQILGMEERPAGDGGASKSYVRIREIPAELVEAGLYRIKEPGDALDGSGSGAASVPGVQQSNDHSASPLRPAFPTTGSFIAEPGVAREALVEPVARGGPAERMVSMPPNQREVPVERMVAMPPSHASPSPTPGFPEGGVPAARFEFPKAGSFVAEPYSDAGAPLYAQNHHGIGAPPMPEPMPPYAVSRYAHEPSGRLSPMYNGGGPCGMDSYGGNRYALPPAAGGGHPDEFGGHLGGSRGDTYSGGTVTYGLSPTQVAAGYGASGCSSHVNGYSANGCGAYGHGHGGMAAVNGYGANGYGANGCSDYPRGGCGNGYPHSLGDGCGVDGYGVPGHHGPAPGACDYGVNANAGYGFPTAGSFIAEPFAQGAPAPQLAACHGDMYNGAGSPMHPPAYPPGYGAGVGLGGAPGFGPSPLGGTGFGALGPGPPFPVPSQGSFIASLDNAAPPIFGAGGLASLGKGGLPDGKGTGAGPGLGAGTPPRVRPPKDADARPNGTERPSRSSKPEEPKRGKKKLGFVGCC